jgi:hypothetical protein
MPQYQVLEPLRHDGALYLPGDAVEMEAKEARELLTLGVLSLALQGGGPEPEGQPSAKGGKKGKQNGGNPPEPSGAAAAAAGDSGSEEGGQ